MAYVMISPNTLTISRIVLTVLFIMFISNEGFTPKLVGAIIFFIASFTDFYDGYIAKKHNLVSDFGKLMDPIADKFLMLSAFLIFVKMGLVTVLAFLVIFGREVLITIMRIHAKTKGKVLAAEKLGKYKTASQVIAAGAILIYVVLGELPSFNEWSAVSVHWWMECIEYLILVAVTLTLVSGVSYYMNNRKIINV